MTPKELLTKYIEEIDSISKFEKETHIYGYYNAWWVFGEVSKELDYDIFMAEAENVGYKRTKRGENPMPNDLYDLEFAPSQIDTEAIMASYEKDIKLLKDLLAENKKELEAVEKKNAEKETEALKKKAEKLIAKLKLNHKKLSFSKLKTKRLLMSLKSSIIIIL